MSGVVLRRNQRFAVEETLRAFDEGRKLVVLDSPTGSGKSIIAGELCRRYGGRAFVTTPQTSLVEQYFADPNFRALVPDAVVLTGRDNYPCERDARLKRGTTDAPMRVSAATCYELTGDGSIAKYDEGPARGKPVPCVHKRWAESLPACEYYRRKALAELAPTVVTTLAYFVVGTASYDPDDPLAKPGWRFGRLSGRPLLVVDEAHGLPEELVRFLSSAWNEYSYPNTLYGRVWMDWCDRPGTRALLGKRGVGAEESADLVESLANALSGIPEALEGSDDPRVVRFLESLAVEWRKLGDVVEDVRAGIPWVVRYQQEKVYGRATPVLTLQPVDVVPYLDRLLWDRVERAVVMSGTPPTAAEIGAKRLLPGRLVTLPSEFPPEYSPVVRLSATWLNAQNREDTLPKALAALWRILDVEPGRGVVHTQSFRNVDAIADALPDRFRSRLVFHRPKLVSRADLIDEFQHSAPPGSVLVSPSVTEGLDLPGDRGEFVVWFKCPFDDLTDDWIAKRRALPDGERWYRRRVLVKTIQGSGRCTRSASDTARTYLIDGVHSDFLWGQRAELPPHFIDRIDAGDRLLNNPDIHRALVVGRTAAEVSA